MAERYPVHLDRLREHFPPHVPVPLLLTSFARWLRTKAWGSVGAFTVTSDRWKDWGENVGDLYNHFATFLNAADGSRMAFWLPEATPLTEPPVVLIGSEGQTQLLADTLGQFLLKLANNRFEVLSGYDLRDRETTREFKAWLNQNGVSRLARKARWPNFPTWFQVRLDAQRSALSRDPIRVRLGELLREIEPPPADPDEWWTGSFDVVCVGRSFLLRRMRDRPIGKKKLAEAEELFRLDRHAATERVPERGVWFSAFVSVSRMGMPYSPHGEAHLSRDFYNEPQWGESPARIPLREYRSDLKKHPRSRFWTPKWLASRLRADR